jgi:hypothetical protein
MVGARLNAPVTACASGPTGWPQSVILRQDGALPESTRPLLRGMIHQAAFSVSLVVGTLLIVAAKGESRQVAAPRATLPRRFLRRPARPRTSCSQLPMAERRADPIVRAVSLGWLPDKKRRLVVVFAGYAIATIAARALGYPVAGRVVVRCRQGHLFTTIWIPGASLKSLRLGWWRVQRCPVGQHLSIVKPVRESKLTKSERRAAENNKDFAIP